MKKLSGGLLVVLAVLTACTRNSSHQRGAATTPSAVGQATFSSSAPLPDTNFGGFRIVERGRHYRVWQRPGSSTNGATGGPLARRNRPSRFVELASGLHAFRNGSWVEADPSVRSASGGAAATNSGQSLFFSTNPNVSGALSVTTPEGQTLASHVLGLSLFDPDTGTNVFIAQLQDSTGRILNRAAGTNNLPDAVFYTNALAGSCGTADLLYVSKRSGIEQFVLFRRQMAHTPEDYGLNGDRAVLQLWTEFPSAPNPAIKTVSTNFPTDQQIQFGSMRIRSGSAFLIGESTHPSRFTHVSTCWTNIGNRTFLIERVPLRDLQRFFADLPKAPSSTNQSASLSLPPPPRNSAVAFSEAPSASAMKTVAYNWKSGPALAWDFSLTDGQSNFTFQADTTYVITGDVYLSGKTIFEGGSVIKFLPLEQTLWIDDTFECRTSGGRPLILTASDDDSVGDRYPSSTGVPDGYYPYTAVFLNGQTNQLSNVRVSYAYAGVVYQEAPVPATLRNAQFIDCFWPIAAELTELNLQNCLFWNADAALTGDLSDFYCNNLTFDTCDNLTYDYGMLACTLRLTNSLLVAVTNLGSFSEYDMDYIATNSDPASAFQTVGGGHHYLQDRSPYRGAGTTNIPPDLLADLRTKTTAPPLVLASQTISANTALSPQAERMTAGVDLGYAYDPIDYAFANVTVTNPITISAAPGTVIAGFGTNGVGRSLTLVNGATFRANGTATELVRVLPYTAVQETTGSDWASPFYSIVTDDINEDGSPPPGYFNCRFAEFDCAAAETVPLGILDSPYDLRDCQFNGGTVVTYTTGTVTITNCLLNRVQTYLTPFGNGNCILQNNLFYGGAFIFETETATNGTLSDNFFDHTDVYFEDLHYAGGCNAFVNFESDFPRIYPTNATDLIISANDYVPGPLGRFYYPTSGTNLNSLRDAGSVSSAGLVGLYHFTTTTNLIDGLEVRDGSTRLDVGFHFVATDANGVPIDDDGDGLVSYLENLSGSGTVGAGESDWQSYNSKNGLTTGNGLQVFTPLK